MISIPCGSVEIVISRLPQKYFNKQQCLFTNLSHDCIGFMTTNTKTMDPPAIKWSAP